MRKTKAFLSADFADFHRSATINIGRQSHIYVILTCILLQLSGCGGEQAARKSEPEKSANSSPSHHLRIAAASDLKFALVDLVIAFEEHHPDATITVTPGSSGNFFAQLSNEAPFDLFLSADVEYPQKLVDQGQGVRGTEFKYGVGAIVVWVPKDSPLDVDAKGLEVLREESAQRIAIANPQHAPYGRAAVAALKSAELFEAIEPRLVYGENIAQTAQMVESGAADVGLIALSLAVSPVLRDKGKYWRVPSDSHPPIIQGGVVLRWATDPDLAKAFRELLLSDEGGEILKRFGFEPAGE